MGIWRYFVDEHALEGVVAGLPLWGLLGVVGATVLVLTKGADWLVEGAAGLALGNGEEADGRGGLSMGMLLLMLGGGLALVVGASRMLIPAAGETARRLGVPDEVIAATMVALGTSLPELTTAVAAIRKGHPEITVGNIVGADVLNALFVIGAASLAVPLAVPRSFYVFHFPMMLLILFSFRVFIGLGRGGRFRRRQGVWLPALYAGYVVLQYAVIQ